MKNNDIKVDVLSLLCEEDGVEEDESCTMDEERPRWYADSEKKSLNSVRGPCSSSPNFPGVIMVATIT